MHSATLRYDGYPLVPALVGDLGALGPAYINDTRTDNSLISAEGGKGKGHLPNDACVPTYAYAIMKSEVCIHGPGVGMNADTDIPS